MRVEYIRNRIRCDSARRIEEYRKSRAFKETLKIWEYFF